MSLPNRPGARLIEVPEGRQIKDLCVYGSKLIAICDDFSAWYLSESSWERISPLAVGLGETMALEL